MTAEPTGHGAATRPRRARTGKGRFSRTVDSAERDARACELRAQGLTYQRIADELGYGNRELARRGVERALLAIVAEPAGHLRTLELARLDEAWQRAWAVMEREHVVVSNGRLIMDPATGKPLRDDGPVLAAIDRLLRIQERRARLLGLDAPIKHIPLDAVEAEIERLSRELGLGTEVPS
jgi:hypothetical protein